MSLEHQEPQSLCPVCGAPNACSVANGSAKSCWCFEVKLTPSQREKLLSYKGEPSCLCPKCLHNLSVKLVN